MFSPKVSVIIPTYNRLSFLKKSVQSVLLQTYKNYELIISDNRSNDGTKRWAQKLAKQNSNIKYFRNSKNLGMVGNWNVSILRANGKYIAILMDDDSWHNQFLKKTVKILDRQPNVGLTCVQVVPRLIVSDQKRKKKLKKIYPKDFYRLYKNNMKVKGIDCIVQYLESQWLVGLPSAILVRRSCFQHLGLFDNLGLDQEMWLRICSRYNFYYLDQKFCFWGIHDMPSYTTNLAPQESIYRQLLTVDKIRGYQYSLKDLKRIFSASRKAYQRLRRSLLESLLKDLKNFSTAISIYRLHASLWQIPWDLLVILQSRILKKIKI